MYLLDKVIECKSRSDRAEIFPLYDMHVGKRNFAEEAFLKQRAEILRRNSIPNRHAFVLLGGDLVNAINPADIRRFDFDELADWFIVPSEAELAKAMSSRDVAAIIRAKLNNIVNQEVAHATALLDPIKHLILGAIYGNHEKAMRTKQNVDVHSSICERLGIVNFTDEALIRFRFKRGGKSCSKNSIRTVVIYMRHGYGGGRTPGTEPNKLQRLVDEWECADVSLTGHTHTYCILPPKPVPDIPRRGMLPDDIHYRYRFGANPGCWLLSHLPGPGSYESMAAYPARPMMTLKIVIWPFWSTRRGNKDIEMPKIELREYRIL